MNRGRRCLPLVRFSTSGVLLIPMEKRVKSDLLTHQNGGFWSRSNVAKQYQIADGLLRRVGDGCARTYNPFAEVELPTALARICSEEISPLEFASDYGELGYTALVRTALVPSFSACLPKSPEWKAAHTAYKNYQDALYSAARNLPEGDPEDWLLAHSRTVALCLEFIGLLEEGDEEQIREAIEGVQRGPYARGVHLFTMSTRDWRKSLQDGVPASALIRRNLSDIISENIAGVRRWLVTDPHCTRSESFFLCNAMIEAVYWQLADRMEAKMVRRCLECRRFFVSRDKRQQYCPPLPGSSRSRCSSRLNVKNWRDRHE